MRFAWVRKAAMYIAIAVTVAIISYATAYLCMCYKARQHVRTTCNEIPENSVFFVPAFSTLARTLPVAIHLEPPTNRWFRLSKNVRTEFLLLSHKRLFQTVCQTTRPWVTEHQ